MKKFVNMGVLKEQDFNILEGLNQRYYEEDLKHLYELDYLCNLYNVNQLQSSPLSVKIDRKKLKSIDIDDFKVKFKIKSLIVDGPKHDEDRSKKIFHVVIELLKAKHTPEEIAFVLLNREWAIGEKISDRPRAAQLKYIAGVIKNTKERLNNDEQQLANSMGNINIDDSTLYEYNNCYYEKKERLSNFIFIPEKRIYANQGEYLKGYIVLNNDEKINDVILTPKAFSSKKCFIEELNSTKISWLGGEKHLQYLKELYMTKDIVEHYAVNKVGIYKDMFITPNQVINSEGVIENSKYMYMPKLTDGQMDFELSLDILSFNEWKELAKKVLPLLVQINEEAIINTIIGWHFIAPAVPLLRKYTDNAFPQLMIWGTQSAGKTSTAQLFGKLFGNPEVRSCTRPAFSITREVDLLNGVPLYLDEFRPHNMSASNWKGLKKLSFKCV